MTDVLLNCCISLPSLFCTCRTLLSLPAVDKKHPETRNGEENEEEEEEEEGASLKLETERIYVVRTWLARLAQAFYLIVV